VKTINTQTEKNPKPKHTPGILKTFTEQIMPGSVHWSDQKIDLHAWVACTRTGLVLWDPYFSNYDYVKRLHGVDRDEVRQYERLTGAEETTAWKFVWGKVVKPWLKENRQVLHVTDEKILRMVVQDPVPNMCFMNAWAYHITSPRPTRMQLGKMGWRTKTGDMHWEFG
jgi:hypothetical protein